MTEAEIIEATYWAGFWSRLEHWMFAGVVITLAVEFLALKFAEPHKEKLEHQREFRIAELSKEGERLSKEAETAKLALEKFKAPRPFNRPQRDKFVAGLKKFAGMRVDILVYVYGTSPDTKNFGNAFWVECNNAGLKAKYWEVGPNDLPGFSGVKVSVKFDEQNLRETSNARNAAEEMVGALKEAEIEGASRGWTFLASDKGPPGRLERAPSGFAWDPDDIAPIRIHIGSKPE